MNTDLPILAYGLRKAEARYTEAVKDMTAARAEIRSKMIEANCRTFNYLGDMFYLDAKDELRVMATVQEGRSS